MLIVYIILIYMFKVHILYYGSPTTQLCDSFTLLKPTKTIKPHLNQLVHTLLLLLYIHKMARTMIYYRYACNMNVPLPSVLFHPHRFCAGVGICLCSSSRIIIIIIFMIIMMMYIHLLVVIIPTIRKYIYMCIRGKKMTHI